MGGIGVPRVAPEYLLSGEVHRWLAQFYVEIMGNYNPDMVLFPIDLSRLVR
jgi:hypothetical protein